MVSKFQRNVARQFNMMQQLTFGIEIETFGQTRDVVAEAVASVVGGSIHHQHYPVCYDTRIVTASDGRQWKVMADSSIRDNSGRAAGYRAAEVVSPILRYDDIPMMQEVVRAVRRCGARVNSSCGIHIHIGADALSGKAIRNLVKQVAKQEELIYDALNISASRAGTWCQQIDDAFLTRIESLSSLDRDALNTAWYGYRNHSPRHYDGSRYHGLNLHNVWFRGTVEFRWFDATLHAGKVKAYVQFVMAIAAKAINSRCARSARRARYSNATKAQFYVYLKGLGLVGDEFKTARLHLTAHLEGPTSSFKLTDSERAASEQAAA